MSDVYGPILSMAVAQADKRGSYDPAHPQVMTVNELMARWRIDRKRIYEAISEGRLKAFRVGKRVYRVTLAEVERFEKARDAW